jgi:plastocyanin
MRREGPRRHLAARFHPEERMKYARYFAMPAACMLLLACGGASSSAADPPQYLITISGMAFSPQDLTVPPGATVTVQNEDGFAHSITSESSPASYAPGDVDSVSFDTGEFTGARAFTIPGTATPGTVIPYYCRVFTSKMANTAQITVGPKPPQVGISD